MSPRLNCEREVAVGQHLKQSHPFAYGSSLIERNGRGNCQIVLNYLGAGGSTFAFLKGSVFPEYLSISMSVESLIMVLLGGIHTLAGAPVGAAAYKILDTLITNVTDYWQAALGGLLILMVMGFPQGIVGCLRGRGSRAEGEGG